MIYFIYVLNYPYSLKVSSTTLTWRWWKECVCAMMMNKQREGRTEEMNKMRGGLLQQRLDSGELVEIAYLLGP